MAAKKNRQKSYTEEFKKYQNKQYLPGYYTGSRIHPMFRAKTKAGGFWLILIACLMLGGFLLEITQNKILVSDMGKIYKIGVIIYLGIFVMIFLLGAKVLLTTPQAKKHKSKR